MGGLRRLPIDMERLAAAMEEAFRPDNEYYLDVETGEVVLLPEELASAVQRDDWDERKKGLRPWEQSLGDVAEAVYLGEGERWVVTPAIPAREEYELMARFVQTVEDKRLRKLLEVALDGRGAFRRFKDVLAGFPDERQRWFAFRDTAVRQLALDWLHSLGLELRVGTDTSPGSKDKS